MATVIQPNPKTYPSSIGYPRVVELSSTGKADRTALKQMNPTPTGMKTPILRNRRRSALRCRGSTTHDGPKASCPDSGIVGRPKGLGSNYCYLGVSRKMPVPSLGCFLRRPVPPAARTISTRAAPVGRVVALAAPIALDDLDTVLPLLVLRHASSFAREQRRPAGTGAR